MKPNKAQQKIISEIYGQYIVIACPGSGKTTTILRRIHHMVESEGISPEEILMITFTKAAAKEMKERYETQFAKDSGVTFCTIHSLCISILKKFMGFTMEQILADGMPLLAQTVKDLPGSEKIQDMDSFLSEAMNEISCIKNNMENVQDHVPFCCSDREFFQKMFCGYEKMKQERDLLDYDDLLVLAYDALSTNQECVDFIRSRYPFIHVDEYQDTNNIQMQIVYLIAGKNGNITVVGDDDQSIYAFRGAMPEVMQDFTKHYLSAEKIYMNTNYRSDKSVIAYASRVIEHNTIRFSKDIRAASEEEGSVRAVRSSTKEESAFQTASDIMGMVNGGTNPNDIAVLYRTNVQAMPIMDALSKLDIAFYSMDGIPDRYKDDMFLDILAYHRMAKRENLQDAKDAFIRTITRPQRFFHNYQNMNPTDTAEQMKRKAYDPSLESWRNEKMAKDIEQYHKMLAFLRILSPAKMLDALYKQCGYREYLKEYAQYRNIPFAVLEDQWEMYKSDIERMKIRTFDEWIAYAKKYSAALEKRQEEQSGVCLSTMHKSKGLEWDHVYIIDCVEGRTPSWRAKAEFEMEEERRLFYVAMTRAKHNLSMMYYESGMGRKVFKPSRFLSESGAIKKL